MNEHQESASKNHNGASIWRAVCSYREEREVGETGAIAQSPVGGKARRNLLKTGKLEIYQIGAKLPSFGQATDWPKRETLWASGRKICRHSARHADCTRGI
jgi:hypothetical protein